MIPCAFGGRPVSASSIGSADQSHLRKGPKRTRGLIFQKRNAAANLDPLKRDRRFFVDNFQRRGLRLRIGIDSRLNPTRQEFLDFKHRNLGQSTANCRRDGNLRAGSMCAGSGGITFLQRTTHNHRGCGFQDSLRHSFRESRIRRGICIGHVGRSLHTPWKKWQCMAMRWPTGRLCIHPPDSIEREPSRFRYAENLYGRISRFQREEHIAGQRFQPRDRIGKRDRTCNGGQ